jgi:hypothetical protein
VDGALLSADQVGVLLPSSLQTSPAEAIAQQRRYLYILDGAVTCSPSSGYSRLLGTCHKHHQVTCRREVPGVCMHAP